MCCLIQLTHRDRLGSIKVSYFHAILSLANSVTSEINVYTVILNVEQYVLKGYTSKC